MWWLYDVKTDTARPLRGVRGCYGAVAVWRRRVAYFDDCDGPDQAVLVHEPGRTLRFPAGSEPDFEQVALRGKSLATMGEANEDMTIRRLLDRGHRCSATIPGGAADGPFSAQHLGIANGELLWVMGFGDSFTRAEVPLYFRHPTVVGVALNGRCAHHPVQRYFGTYGADASLRAATVDARKLYYATKRALYVQRLPARGSTSAPPNDNFEKATVLRGPLPLLVEGTVGYATRQSGEPEYTAGGGTVWYSFRPQVNQRVNVDFGLGAELLGYGVLTGDRLDALRPMPYPIYPDRYTIDVVAGTRYWIVVSGDPPNFVRFRITISAA